MLLWKLKKTLQMLMRQTKEKLHLNGIPIRLTLVVEITMKHKKEVFHTTRCGSTSGSMTTNTNNKSKTPRYLCQIRTAKRDSLSETAEKSEGQKFPNRTTGSTSQNVCERRQ